MPRKKSPIEDAKSITASLGRTSKAMAATVSTADAAVSGLVDDGEVIADTLDTHKYSLKSELGDTRSALRRVKIAAFKEKWLIWGSLGFFTSTVAYIITKRTRLLTLVWLFLSGAYHGGSYLGHAMTGDKDSVVPEPVQNSGSDGDWAKNIDSVNDGIIEAQKEQEGLVIKEVGISSQGDFLDIDIINYTEDGIPIPPQQFGPLTEEEMELAAMFDAMQQQE